MLARLSLAPPHYLLRNLSLQEVAELGYLSLPTYIVHTNLRCFRNLYCAHESHMFPMLIGDHMLPMLSMITLLTCFRCSL